jgi:16S rRNA (cytidine1402-2'-O)-methyltransferase
LLFVGFLPAKGEMRQKKLAKLFEIGYNFVVYEAPHRMAQLLTECATLQPDRPLLIGREMTKIHEEFWRGTSTELLARYGEQKMQGEFVVLVGGN